MHSKPLPEPHRSTSWPGAASFSSEQPSKSLAILIVHHRSPDHTIACLSRLVEVAKSSLTCIVSTAHPDPQRDWLRVVDFGKSHHMVLLDAGSNPGFPAACNLGFASLSPSPDFLWLLNPDTLPDPEALDRLLSRISSDHSLAAVASQLDNEPSAGYVSLFRGLAYPTLSAQANPHFVSAASLLLRTSALQQVGLLDESLFLYWEDVELCLRLRKAGWKLAVEPLSRVSHIRGASAGNRSPLQDYYASRNPLLVVRKHAPWLLPCAGMFVFLRITLAKLIRGEFSRLAPSLTGFFHGLQGRTGKAPEHIHPD